MTSTPELLAQIQNNFTQMFLIRPATKIAIESYSLVQIQNNYISIKSTILHVPYIALYQSCSNDSVLLLLRIQVSDLVPLRLSIFLCLFLNHF